MSIHPDRLRRICLAITASLTLLIAGCAVGSGGAPGPAPTDSTPDASPTLTTALGGFPEPLDLFALLSTPKQPAYTADDLWQTGSAFNALLPANNVSIEEPAAVFHCGWDAVENPSTTDLAYAFYVFDLADYDLPGTLLTSWQVPPTDLHNLWIGFGNLGNNAWDWHGGDGSRAVNTTGFDAYIDPVTDQMLVAIVLMGGGDPELSELRIGGIGGTGTLGPVGGSLSFGDVGVNAPTGALLETQQVTYTPASPPIWLPPGFQPVGFAHRFSLSDESKVESPLIFELPFGGAGEPPPGELAVLSYDPEWDEFQLATIRQVLPQTKTILIHSRYAPIFIVGYFTPTSTLAYSLDFDPADDGWEIANFGGYFTYEGNCLGMSGYSVWFYNHRASEQLWGKFSTAGGSPASTAHLMSTRAQLAQSQYWALLNFNYQQTLADVTVFDYMKYSIETLSNPVVLLMTSPGGVGHACVAYGWNESGLLFYDVNFPGQSQTLVYGEMTGFGTYDIFENFGYVTTPALGRPGDFAQLTLEGEAEFGGSDLIEISSPQPGELITQYQTALSGALTGPMNPDIMLTSYTNGIRLNVYKNGDQFSGNVLVRSGDLDIIVLAGVDMHKQSSWFPNGAIQAVKAVGGVPSANLEAQLYAFGDEVDLELYVTEPNGETSWYGEPATSNGLEFVEINTFDPIQKVAVYSAEGDTVLPGLYDIRVHCANNPTGGPVIYYLRVSINRDTTPYQGQMVYFRNLVADEWNELNITPGSTGTDWTDVVSVDVANGVAY